MDNTTKIESMAGDLHLLAAPFRLIFTALKVVLFTMSFPLLCGLVVVSYALPGIDPLQRYLEFFQARHVSFMLQPFIILGAFLMLAVNMLLIIARDLGGMADILLRVPLFGTVLFALVTTVWFIVVRGVYLHRDGEKNLSGWSSFFFGFTVAFVAGQYVWQVQGSLPPASLFCLATLAAFSPTLLYLLYRGLKPTR
jgi:hypothetical protein